MENINFTDKEQVFYNKYIGNFATPKKLNRSTKSLKPEYIDKIEAGEVTSQLIKEISQIVPVFTYKTCLTIHGNLPEIERSRIGGYKNIIQNKNGSLEIRYSAIDSHIKREISHIFRVMESEYNTKENSTTGRYFEKVKTANEKDEALKILQQMKQEAESLKIEGMKAKIYVSGYSYWGRYYLITTILPLLISETPENICSQLLNVPVNDIKEKVQEYQKQKEQEAEQHKQKAEQTEAARQKALNEALTVAAQTFTRSNLQAIEGKVYILPSVSLELKPLYKFFKVTSKGSFNRVKIEAYSSSSPTYSPEKLQPYRKGKQVAIAEINPANRPVYSIN